MADEFTTGNLYLGENSPVDANNFDIRLSTEDNVSTVFNNSGNSTDFRVNASGEKVGLHVDADSGRVGVGTGNNVGASLHVVTSCANDGLRVESTTDCPTGVQIEFIHKPETAPVAGSHPVQINLAGRNTNDSDINYARIKSKILSATTSQETGELRFSVIKDGEDVDALVINPLTTSIGSENSQSGNNYLFIGSNNLVSGNKFIIFGSNNTGLINNGILLGADNHVSGDRLLIVADNSVVSGDQNIVFALDSEVYGDSNLVIAENVYSTGDQNIIFGHNTESTGDFNILLLNDSSNQGNSGVGFGNQVLNRGDKNVYLGNYNTIVGQDDLVVGSEVEVTGSNNILYGSDSSLSGDNIISIGAGNDIINIVSGVFIGSDIDLNNSEKSVVIGLANATTGSLDTSVILGLDNTTTNGDPTGIVVIGQQNTVARMKDTTIVGNSNQASGLVLNNVVYGNLNSTPSDSRNNIIVGVMNNTTGNILSAGTLQPSGRIDGTMVNSVAYGVNNIINNVSGSNVLGSKNYASGENINILGSLNQAKNSYDTQILGHSNLSLGEKNTIIGSQNDIIGSHSVLHAASQYRNQLFGSGNISIGNTEIVISGMSIGFNNDIDAPQCIVFGSGNHPGIRRHLFTVTNDGSTQLQVQGDVTTTYQEQMSVMIAFVNPTSADDPIRFRSINSVNYNNAGGSNNFTTITINTALDLPSTNLKNYTVSEFFDEPTFQEGENSVITGWIMPFQSGETTFDPNELINNPQFGISSIILGNNNKSLHASGLIFGQDNDVSGVRHIVIGNSISGYYNNAVQIGTNNTNKMFLDDDQVVFNTGGQQNDIVFNSSTEGVAAHIDLIDNQVGINNSDPQSTLDVSGIITAEGLKLLGDFSDNSGWIPINTGDGGIQWQRPTTLSGMNSGIVMKVSDYVSSGLETYYFNPSLAEISYDRSTTLRDEKFVWQEGDAKANAIKIDTLGMYFNQDDILRDRGYQFIVYGSGTTSPLNNNDGTDNVYLLRTDTNRAEVQFTNITGLSGALNQLDVNDGVKLPANLTGTFLYVDNETVLKSRTTPNFSVLFTRNDSWQSGNESLRYYYNSGIFTIGGDGSQVGLDNGWQPSDEDNNIILAQNENTPTIFNNRGLGQDLIICESGAGISQQGLVYNTESGVLGIGVTPEELIFKTDGTASNRVPFYEADPSLVMYAKGKVRIEELQLGNNQGGFPSNPGRYLRLKDLNGNIELAEVQVTTDFKSVLPITTDPLDIEGEEVTYMLAETGLAANGPYGTQALNDGEDGIVLAWNGSSWVQSVNVRFCQPPVQQPDSTYDTEGTAFGTYATLPTGLQAGFAVAGKPIVTESEARTNQNYRRSVQQETVFLKAITKSDTSVEMTTNFAKENNNNQGGGGAGNTINLILDEYTFSDTKKHIAWRFEIEYTAMIQKDGSTAGDKFDLIACHGKTIGGIKSFVNSDQSRGAPAIYGQTNEHYNSDNLSNGAVPFGTTNSDPNPAITTSIVSGGSFPRLQVIAQAPGVGFSCMITAVVKLTQLSMPNNLEFTDTSV